MSSDINAIFLKKLRLAERDGYRCAICGRPEHNIKKLTIDHIVPIARGGASNFQNLQLSHRRCNNLKSDVLPWRSIPEIDRTYRRLAMETYRIIKNVPKGKVVSYRQLAILLGDASLETQLEVIVDEYATFQRPLPDKNAPIHRVVDDGGYIPTGLPKNIRENHRAKLLLDGLRPSRDGRIDLGKWGAF